MPFRGDLLRAWRAANKRSQVASANEIGISQSMWTLLERGKAEPSTNTLVAIARLTGISTDVLLDTPTRQSHS